MERVQFDSLSLVSPYPSDALDVALTARKVAHSLRVYKGKIFVLVSLPPQLCEASP